MSSIGTIRATRVTISSVDRAAFYQLKSMMQGVLARGTARSIAGLAPYVAGKTGTSDDENDAWFVGFTNEVTVAVWIGYDNADGKRRTLGGGSTGGGLAVPIFAPGHPGGLGQCRAARPSWPRRRRKPSGCCRASRSMWKPARSNPASARVSECFRVDAKGRIIDTQNRLLDSATVQAEDDDERTATRARRYEDRNTTIIRARNIAIGLTAAGSTTTTVSSAIGAAGAGVSVTSGGKEWPFAAGRLTA